LVVYLFGSVFMSYIQHMYFLYVLIID